MVSEDEENKLQTKNNIDDGMEWKGQKCVAQSTVKQ